MRALSVKWLERVSYTERDLNRQRVPGSDRFVFSRIVFDIDVNQERRADEEIIRCEIKCEIKYEIDLYVIINFSFFIISRGFPLFHSDLFYGQPRFLESSTMRGNDPRPTKLTDYAIVSQAANRTQSQLYRPGIVLYVIESISFVTVARKRAGPDYHFSRDPSF